MNIPLCVIVNLPEFNSLDIFALRVGTAWGT